jgi:predicted permease
LRHTPVSVIATLALTVALSTTVFSVLDAVFIRPLPYRGIDRIFAMRTISPQGYTQPASYPEFTDWRRQSAPFAALAGYSSYKAMNAEIGGSAVAIRAVMASDNFFEIFGVSPILGRTFEKGEEDSGRKFVAVLSNEIWQTMFGSRPSAIGEKIKLDGRPYTVIGVMPAGFRFPISQLNAIYIPLDMAQVQRESHGNHWLPTIARLAPGISREQAQSHYNQIFDQLGQAYPASKNRRVELVDLATDVVGNRAEALRLLGYAVLALMVMGCVNLAGVLLARGISREHEIAIRGALGANRRRIAVELLRENVVHAIAGGVLGVALAYAMLRGIGVLVVAALSRGSEVELNSTVLAASLAISMFTSLAAGLWPALRLSGFSAATSLRAGQRGGMDRGQNRLRAAFVTVQVALALVLLVTSGLVFRALARLQHAEFGFDPSHTLAVQIDLSPGAYEKRDVMVDFYSPLLARVNALHGVRGAGLIQVVPIQSWGWNSDVQIVGQPPAPPNQERLAEIRYVTPGTFSAFGIHLLRGRLLDDKIDTPASPPTAVVNQRFVERFFPPGVDPIGQAIDRDEKVTIVGVVSNIRQNPYAPPLAEMDFPVSQFPSSARSLLSSTSLIVRTDGDPETIVPDLRRTFADLDHTLPFRTPRTMDEIIARALTLQRLENWLFGSFAALALILALIGLYGLISQEVELSRREIGIRMAVGATGVRIFARVYRRVGGMLAAGIAGGLAATWVARQLIASVAEINAQRDGQLLVMVVLVFAAVALGAAFLPAQRAATVDPVETLRAE